jgi:soluble lytic murein transglycosylase-like protein
MRSLMLGGVSVLATLVLAASASAAVPHTVGPGETLWTIAAANNFTTRSLAAYNGLSPDANVVLGSTVMIPAEGEAATAMQQGTATAAPATTTSTSTGTSASTASGPRPMGGYTVQPGDTLSGLAARAGVPASQVAWMNGLASDAQLVTGTSLKLPTGAPVPATPAPATPTPAAPQAAPYATPSRMSSVQVGSIAAQSGVPSSLAAAVAYQESGFNNDMVSPTSARGIMQIMPGTWEYVQRNLSAGPLNPSSAADNVKAGSLYLASLLRDTGGDVPTAVAGYYQGLGSVRSRGLYDDTKRYVANVMALRGRFGG